MRYLILILFVLPLQISGQYTISGTVSNTRGEHLSFATVYIPGTAYAASTDDHGKYIITDVAPDQYTFIVKFVGYRVHTQDVTIHADQKIDVVLQGEIYNLDAVEILANRVGQKGPFTKQNLSKETLLKENLGQDVPFILQWTPSMVVTSDAGTGIGYTGMRLRGSDQTRINVTLNGVPVNEAESHNVFWVDLPDLMGSAQSIQIQRGAGTSTNGAGAFGGTVSINTAEVRVNPYVDIFSTLGSFNTQKLSVHVGTGLINDRYVIDGRYSTVHSDGYVDRANARLNSLFFSAARVSSKSSLRLNVISGKEITYQSWSGVPQAKVDNNQEGLVSHYDRNVGSLYKSDADSVNLFASDRKYNYYSYANQIDNYRQTYVQLLHSLALKPNLK
ncbi:MAG: TonB-dependent receptor, partial [Saprospiraceae bacterium]|nr:TonB-dependent receptor [Saprospiraceae bacterium]